MCAQARFDSAEATASTHGLMPCLYSGMRKVDLLPITVARYKQLGVNQVAIPTITVISETQKPWFGKALKALPLG